MPNKTCQTQPSTILITGSSSGIGAATAEYFHKRGWNVAASCRKKPEQSPQDPRWICPRLDVTEDTSVTAAVEETLSRFGSIDVLVNNAGHGLNGPMEAISRAEWDKQWAVNFFGLVETTKAVLPVMRQAGGGTVINISSIGGRVAFPFGAPYHATKFAVEGLSEAIRYELSPHGIRVKVIEPGGIRTDFLTRSIRWVLHPAYEPAVGRFKTFTESLNESLPGPEHVARVIWKAVHDKSDRLRYAAKPGPYLLMHSLLPDSLWRRLILWTLTMHAKVNGTARTRKAGA